MNRRGSRRGRGVSRPVRNYVHRQDRMVAYGRELKPGPFPNAIVDQPWNSCVLQLGNVGDSDITNELAAAQLCKQMGLICYDAAKTQLGTVDVDMRYVKIRVWALKNKAPISLSVLGFTEDASQPSQIYTCWPGSNRLPSVGYEWPQFYQTALYNATSDKDQRVARVDVGKDIPWLAYVDVLWRSSSHQPISEAVSFTRAHGIQTSSMDIFN